MTADAPLGPTPSLLASPLLPHREASAKGEDRTAGPMTADAPLSPTPSLLASPLLPHREASAKGEDRTAGPMPHAPCPMPNDY